MQKQSYRFPRRKGIAFVGNYPPRQCGIATFTHDLSSAIAGQMMDEQPVIVAAMNDTWEGYPYPDRVKFEIRQDHQVDYTRAADFFNFSGVDIVSLQHEYGIFGGENGSNILTLLNNLDQRSVVTCHTVLEHPPAGLRDVLREIASQAERLVVMSERAFSFLEDAYDIPREKIAYIPHGIHDVAFIDPNYYKDKFGVEGRRVLLTFGLLRRDKGLEYMIEALPRIVERHPNTTYVILGATHPAVIDTEGESYRLSLQRRIRELGLENHVLFHPRFVELDELLEYLGATDIFVTPYLYMQQITSGALAYAAGTGKAVVSTAYWHAEELLADDRGRLVPPRDSEALAREINALLDDEVELNAMRKRVYTHCRSMVWPAVARRYMELFDEVRNSVPNHFPVASAMRSPLAATNIPTPLIDHILRICDDTGPFRHACHAVPERQHGYSLEDGATTLVAATKFHANYNDERALRLAETCLGFLQSLIGDEGREVPAGLDYSRRPFGDASEDALAKALWALGYVVFKGPRHLVATAHDLFHRIAPSQGFDSPRAASYTVLGASNYLKAFPGASEIKRLLTTRSSLLSEHLSAPAWWEKWETADWPIALQACCEAATVLDHEGLRELAARLTTTLTELTNIGTVFRLDGEGSNHDESPVTCGTFVEALGAAFEESRDVELLKPIRNAVDWILGANRLNEPLYDFGTGGCCDALTATGVNRNQGNEATVYCQLAFLSLNYLVSFQEVSSPVTPPPHEPVASRS
jgi:glycosyltransferase involved in cell wall biosynthesis